MKQLWGNETVKAEVFRAKDILRKMVHSRLEMSETVIPFSGQTVSRYQGLSNQKYASAMCFLILEQSLELIFGKDGINEGDLAELVDKDDTDGARNLFQRLQNEGLISHRRIKSLNFNITTALKEISVKYALQLETVESYFRKWQNKPLLPEILKDMENDIKLPTRAEFLSEIESCMGEELTVAVFPETSTCELPRAQTFKEFFAHKKGFLVSRSDLPFSSEYAFVDAGRFKHSKEFQNLVESGLAWVDNVLWLDQDKLTSIQLRNFASIKSGDFEILPAINDIFLAKYIFDFCKNRGILDENGMLLTTNFSALNIAALSNAVTSDIWKNDSVAEELIALVRTKCCYQFERLRLLEDMKKLSQNEHHFLEIQLPEKTFDELLFDAIQLGLIERERVNPVEEPTLVKKVVAAVKEGKQGIKSYYGHNTTERETMKQIENRLDHLRGTLQTLEDPVASFVNMMDIFSPCCFSSSKASIEDIQSEVNKLELWGMNHIMKVTKKPYTAKMLMSASASLGVSILEIIISLGLRLNIIPLSVINSYGKHLWKHGVAGGIYSITAFRRGHFSWSDFGKCTIKNASLASISQIIYRELFTMSALWESDAPFPVEERKLQDEIEKLALFPNLSFCHAARLVKMVVDHLMDTFSSCLSRAIMGAPELREVLAAHMTNQGGTASNLIDFVTFLFKHDPDEFDRHDFVTTLGTLVINEIIDPSLRRIQQTPSQNLHKACSQIITCALETLIEGENKSSVLEKAGVSNFITNFVSWATETLGNQNPHDAKRNVMATTKRMNMDAISNQCNTEMVKVTTEFIGDHLSKVIMTHVVNTILSKALQNITTNPNITSEIDSEDKMVMNRKMQQATFELQQL